MNNKTNYCIALGLIVLAVVTRLIDHAPNFTAVGAAALFAGYALPRRLAFVVPLIAMALSDIFIGFYDWRLMAVVYASFLLMTAAGIAARHVRSPIVYAFSIAGGSVLFFLTTNFAVWALSSWYPHTLNGLLWCYTLALPFLKNALMGDMLFGMILYGAYRAAWAIARRRLSFGAAP